MLLDEMLALSKETQDTFKRTLNILLTSNYICKDKTDNTKYYYFVINYKKYFVEFFDILGYELVVNNDLGSIQLINDYSQANVKLKKEETFVALIVRILYQENLINTTLNNTVQITIDEIHNKYASLGFKRKIFKTELVSALRLLKKYNLIDNLGDLSVSATKLLVFPTITMFIPVTDIQECYRYLVELENGKEDNTNENSN